MWKRNTNTAHSGICTTDAMRQLETGVLLLAGQPLSLPARAQLLAHTNIGESAPYLPERFREKYLKNPSRPVTLGRLWITEGRKHQVKLMIKAVGGHVFYLKRLAIGPVRAGRNAPPRRIPAPDSGGTRRPYATGDQRRRYCWGVAPSRARKTLIK